MIGKEAYIKNVGSTQTFIKNPNEKERFNDIHWEAEYDGEQANISVNIDDNGNNAKLTANLDNNDLSRLLNIPVLSGNLDERLRNDYAIPLLEEVEQKPTPLLEEVRPKLRFQPFLRPQNKTRKLLHPKYYKLIKQFKDARAKEPRLNIVGKTAAFNYRTPFPKTMRVHFTSASAERGKFTNTRRKRQHVKRNLTRRNRGISLFRNLL